MTTFVRQIDAQGPAVVERITTQIADVACTPENARLLVDALRNGTEVTLSSEGKTATFTPSGSLGYGEAYIALALAAEALRNAGVTGCATPDQWEAVLLGGPLAAAGTTSTSTTMSAAASSSSDFPGILTLRSQGQGWGQVARRTNVQLGQVMSTARTKLNLESDTDATLSPTGRTSDEMNATGGSSIGPGATDTRENSGNPHSNHPGKGKAKGKEYGKGKAGERNPVDTSDDAEPADRAGRSDSTPPRMP